MSPRVTRHNLEEVIGEIHEDVDETVEILDDLQSMMREVQAKLETRP